MVFFPKLKGFVDKLLLPEEYNGCHVKAWWTEGTGRSSHRTATDLLAQRLLLDVGQPSCLLGILLSQSRRRDLVQPSGDGCTLYRPERPVW